MAILSTILGILKSPLLSHFSGILFLYMANAAESLSFEAPQKERESGEFTKGPEAPEEVEISFEEIEGSALAKVDASSKEATRYAAQEGQNEIVEQIQQETESAKEEIRQATDEVTQRERRPRVVSEKAVSDAKEPLEGAVQKRRVGPGRMKRIGKKVGVAAGVGAMGIAVGSTLGVERATDIAAKPFDFLEKFFGFFTKKGNLLDRFENNLDWLYAKFTGNTPKKKHED